MRPSRVDLRDDVRERLAKILNAELAEAIDLLYHVKQAHWNVRGPAFYGLHKLFDKVAHEVKEHVDLLAERIVQLGGYAQGTIQAAAKQTGLPEYPLDISSGEEHVDHLAESLAGYASGLRHANGVCTTLGDEITVDILTQLMRDTEKFLWMVDAHLATHTHLPEHRRSAKEVRRQQPEFST